MNSSISIRRCLILSVLAILVVYWRKNSAAFGQKLKVVRANGQHVFLKKNTDISCQDNVSSACPMKKNAFVVTTVIEFL